SADTPPNSATCRPSLRCQPTSTASLSTQNFSLPVRGSNHALDFRTRAYHFSTWDMCPRATCDHPSLASAFKSHVLDSLDSTTICAFADGEGKMSVNLKSTREGGRSRRPSG